MILFDTYLLFYSIVYWLTEIIQWYSLSQWYFVLTYSWLTIQWYCVILAIDVHCVHYSAASLPCIIHWSQSRYYYYLNDIHSCLLFGIILTIHYWYSDDTEDIVDIQWKWLLFNLIILFNQYSSLRIILINLFWYSILCVILRYLLMIDIDIRSIEVMILLFYYLLMMTIVYLFGIVLLFFSYYCCLLIYSAIQSTSYCIPLLFYCIQAND